MNNKKIYFILLPAVIILIALVAMLYFSGFTKPRKLEIPSDEKSNIVNQEEQNKQPVTKPKTSGKNDILKMAEAENNPSKCLEYEDEEYAVGCISLVAQRTRNLNSCSLIKNQMEMVKCFDMTLFSKAAIDGNSEFCQEMKDDEMSRSCVVNLVELGKIKRDDCKNLKDREKGYCDFYYSYLGDVAAANSADEEGDCGSINNESAKAFCLDKFAVR
jgi:hypothetical protein